MRVLSASVLSVLLGLALGCGVPNPPPDLGGPDGEKISVLVERMNDDSHTTSKLKDIFATGMPVGKKETKGYPAYVYCLKGKPAVDGTAATGTVLIEKHAGGRPVEKEWTFVKEGDKWKIKSAPLP